MSKATTEIETERATRKEQYDLLIGLLNNHYTGLISSEFKHAALVALVAGWLGTAESPQNFLVQSDLGTRALVCLPLLVLTVFHAKWLNTLYQKSEDVFRHLVKLDYMPAEYFVGRRFPRFSIISFGIIHFIVVVVICVVILLI